MKIEHFNRLMAVQASRRNVLKGAASVGAMTALGPLSGARLRAGRTSAPRSCRSPASAPASRPMPTGRKSASSASAPTKANVAEGEFAGVELTFMGLNNQNLHNVLFRGLLKPWEEYTGATITWIDLAQADYNARLQQAIATGTVDFDMIEMGAPFEGDECGKGLASEMPGVGGDADRDGRLRRLSQGAGRHLGRQDLPHLDRRRLPHLLLSHRLSSPMRRWRQPGRRKATRRMGRADAPGNRCRRVTKFLKGKQDVTGMDAYGYLDAPKAWGGFGFYFLGSRATAYAKHPDDPAWLFDPDTMKPRVNNPAWVRAIQDVIDALPSEPADQLNADPEHDRLPAIPRRHRLDAVVVGRRRLECAGPTTPRSSARSPASRSCPARTTSTIRRPARGTRCRTARTSRPTWPISAGAFT